MTSATHETAAANRKAIVAGAAGNFVEWFDWSIYGYFAIYFSSQFFPKDGS